MEKIQNEELNNPKWLIFEYHGWKIFHQYSCGCVTMKKENRIVTIKCIFHNSTL